MVWSLDFNPLPASNVFRCLLLTFANSLDLDQVRQNIGPGLDFKTISADSKIT